MAQEIDRFTAHRTALAEKKFPKHPFHLVGIVAALISNTKEMKPQAAARRAFEILDACREETLARDQKRATIINARVPVHALQLRFREGICAITDQPKRPTRAEEYFGRFLRSEIGRDAGAKELERLKREGFTLAELKELERRYEEFHLGQRKKR